MALHITDHLQSGQGLSDLVPVAVHHCREAQQHRNHVVATMERSSRDRSSSGTNAGGAAGAAAAVLLAVVRGVAVVQIAMEDVVMVMVSGGP